MQELEWVRAHAPELSLVALAAVLLGLIWVGLRLQRSERRLAELMSESVEARFDEASDQWHAALERLGQRGDAGAERTRAGLERELRGLRDAFHAFDSAMQARLAEQREQSAQRFAEAAGASAAAHERLRAELLEQVLTRLFGQARADRELLQGGLSGVSRTLDERLESIAGHVNQRLDEGFRKTNETFANVMARLATIDEAQKKIDGLTTSVVSLQDLLGDKRARGAFGEVQLEGLVRNLLPPDSYHFQYTLPNGTRVDCALRLPEPTGMVCVDAKFPLENYRRMLDPDSPELDRKLAQTAFRTDVKRHIEAIATKYIERGVTSDGAVMFVPAEAVFAEIHAWHPELIAYALERRVWVVSPTTLMAVLNTARAVLKDVETRKHIHIIKDALGKLAKDFHRFDERMNALARHIDQANRDVQDVQVSSRKITAHFEKIEATQIDEIPPVDGVGRVES
jgi:DNA recombination protein RmuC